MNMKTDWWSCDGSGNADKRERAEGGTPLNPTPYTLHPIPSPSVSRRGLLIGAALAAVGWAAREQSALADVTVDPHGKGQDKDILVNIFLRGGADGLNIVLPHGEDAYYRSRP